MSRMHLCLELSERELHILTFFPETSKDGFLKLNQVKFDSRPISGGWLKQGQVSTQVLTQIIEEVCDTLKIPRQTPAFLAIPLVNGSIRDYMLPWISPQHRKSAIHYLAREETPIPQTNQGLGYAITEENKKLKQMTVRLGVTHRSILESLIYVLKTADLKVISVEFTAVAIGNALNLQEKERYIYLSERDEGLEVILYRGTLPEFTRFFPLYSESNPEESVKEIARLLGSYNKTAEEQVHCIFISGQKSEKLSRKLCTLGLSVLDQRVKIISIEHVFKSFNWRESLPQVILPCLPCLGLAFRCKVKTNPKSVNLLAEYLDRERENHRKQLLAALLLSVTVSSIGLWFYEKNQETLLTTEINNLRTNVEEIQTKDQNASRLYKSWNNLKGDQAGISNPLIALQSLSGGGVSFEQLEYREGMLTLQGTVERAEQLQNLLKALQAQSWGQVRFRQYQQEKPSQIKFAITALHGG